MIKFDPPLIKEACCRMKGWYNTTTNPPPTPRPCHTSTGDIGSGGALQTGAPHDNIIPVEVSPLPIDASIPMVDNIGW